MPAKQARSVALTADQQALIDRLVESGRYSSAADVLRDALRALERDETSRLLEKWLAGRLTPNEESHIPAGPLQRAQGAIRARVQEGLEEARRGEFVDGQAFFAGWKTKLEAAAASKSAGRQASNGKRKAATRGAGRAKRRS